MELNFSLGYHEIDFFSLVFLNEMICKKSDLVRLGNVEVVTGTWSPGNCSSKGDLPSKNKYIGQEEGKKAS